MNHEQLLRKAATACGFNIKGAQLDSRGNFSALVVSSKSKKDFQWNPLENNAQAFELAVKLKFLVGNYFGTCTVWHRRGDEGF